MEWQTVGLLMIVALLVVLLSGPPVAVALILVSIGFLLPIAQWNRAVGVIASEAYTLWSSYDLTALGLFVLMGELLVMAGVAENIYNMASKWLRQFPGGLALVTVGACTIFATLSGSSSAAIATIGLIAIPQMLQRGYSKRLAAGAVGAAGGLAHLIPPSVMMILYATMAEVSVGKLFMAGFIPGFVLATLFAIVVIVWALVSPSSAPREKAAPWKEKFIDLRKGIAPIIVVLAVLGSIYSGIATVTESAAIGSLAAFLLAVFGRRLTGRRFYDTLLSTTKTVSFILLIAFGGKLLSWVLNYYLIPQHILEELLRLEINPWMIMILIQVLYIVLGMFIDLIGMMYVTLPVLLPVLQGLGFDPIWFGVLLMINMEMALVTPPVGFALFILKGIAPKDVSMGDIMFGCNMFVMADVVCLALMMVFPQIVMWLPNTMSFW